MNSAVTHGLTGPDAVIGRQPAPSRPGGDGCEVVDAAAGMRALFAAGGEMGALMAQIDWAANPLGPVAEWPQSLRSTLSIMLSSQQPILLWWGPELVQFYNDAYRPILGQSLHPAALGQQGRVTWSGIWEVIGPLIDTVLGGESTLIEDGLLILDRNGYPEEGYFNYAYSPVRDDSSAIAGIFATCAETTTRVIGERRLRLLQRLSADVGGAQTVPASCDRAIKILAEASHDVPFAAIFLTDSVGRTHVASAFGLQPADLDPAAWPIHRASASTGPLVLTGLRESGRSLPGGPWPEAADNAVLISLPTRTTDHQAAVILGVSPRRALDADYLSFLSVVAGQLTAAIASAQVREEECAKAAAMTALSQAKTDFVVNVSHEFRTPLTLLLGPLETVLSDLDADSPLREKLETAHRNAQRLLRLTNALLDFSKIEDGHFEPSFELVDLSELTTEITRSFQEVFEQSSVELIVACEPATEQVFVDVDLWEKIVLNLLSNAYKFTFSGSVTVATHAGNGTTQLIVTDTGEGIPAAELPRLFERFHRVSGTRSRSHEGTGIGLALVHELVAQHGGTIDVLSTPGIGTTFTITLPLGADHLQTERDSRPRTAPLTAASRHYAAEALRWLPARPDTEPAPGPSTKSNIDQPDRPCILLVDDNADMRRYVTLVLADRYDVRTAVDGAAALVTLRTCAPDLILTDVMMPNVNGLELTSRLRADPCTAHIPVIMLSARAGPEAAVVGLDAGADDYLAKPFTTSELLARCRTNIELSQLRTAALHDAEHRYQREHAVALQLQQALLPDALPSIRNVTCAAHYQPCTEGAQIGGDWFDVIDASDAYVVAVVGDVMGHDLRAAATMARFRNAIRAYAIEDPSPAAILNRVDQFAERLESDFATVIVVTIDTRTGEFRFANAGHPPPLIVGRDSAPRTLLQDVNPPLGLSPLPRTDSRDRLLAGETLLLYTDGLIERRDETITDGLSRLTQAFGALARSHPLSAIPEQLATDLVGDRADDDVALLALSYLPAATSP